MHVMRESTDRHVLENIPKIYPIGGGRAASQTARAIICYHPLEAGNTSRDTRFPAATPPVLLAHLTGFQKQT